MLSTKPSKTSQYSSHVGIARTFPDGCDGDEGGDITDELLPVAVSPAVGGSPETGSSLPSQPRLYYLHLLCTRKGPELVGWDSSVGHPPHASVRKDDIRV